ncbi:MAG TPA: hypothetical protein VNN12_04435 [Dehalococcoidia bacterium]|nr:hypothetical protein [Dehalococcoidia bacterium]
MKRVTLEYGDGFMNVEVPDHAALVRMYRVGYAYHPFHGFSMACMGALADCHARAVYIVGARAPGDARAMGCVALSTFAQALQHAERHVGKSPRLLIVPRLSTVQIHVPGERRTAIGSAAVLPGGSHQAPPGDPP